MDPTSLKDLAEAAMDAYALDPGTIKDFSLHFEGETPVLTVVLAEEETFCPRCHSKDVKIHGYREKRIKHSVLKGRPAILHYRHRRYECRCCHRTYYDRNPFVFNRGKISIQTVRHILADLKSPACTYEAAGHNNGVSAATAARIFDQQIIYPRPSTLPTVLLIDEVYAMGKSRKDEDPVFVKDHESPYVVVLMDAFTRKPIDVLESRRLEKMGKYFRGFPLEERKKVKILCGDMFENYRRLTHLSLPDAAYAVDKFHVVADANEKLDKARIRIMKKYEKRSDEYYLLKNQNGLLNWRPDAVDPDCTPAGSKEPKVMFFDPQGKRKYNGHFKYRLNRYELMEKLLKVDPVIAEIYEVKNALGRFYRENTIDSAGDSLKKLTEQLWESQTPEVREIANTLDEWFIEIVNSFLIIEREYRVSGRSGKLYSVAHRPGTGVLERKNRDVKDLKRTAFGMTNFERARNRILYILDAEPPFPALPEQTEIGKGKRSEMKDGKKGTSKK